MTLLAVVLWLLLGLVPGLLLLAAVRPATGWGAIAAAAPPVSLGVVHGWAVVLTLLGVPVEPLTVVPVALGVPLVAFGFALRLRGVGLLRDRVGLGRAEGVVVAVVSLVCIVLWWRATQGAGLVPPNDDGNNHGLYAGRILALNTVDSRQVTVGDLESGTPPGVYYPLAMHTSAALVSAMGGGDPGRALVVAIAAASAVVLPLGMAVLTRRLFPHVRWAAPVAALLAVAFPAFPYAVTYWGGLALIAGTALAAPLVDALVSVPEQPRPWLAGVVVGVGLAGMFGLHNTELVTVVLLAALLVIATWRRVGTSYVRRALPGLLVAGAVVVLYALPQLGALTAGLHEHTDFALLKAVPPGQAALLAVGTYFGRAGLADLVVSSPLGPTVAASSLFTVSCLLLAALTVLGCVVAWRRGRPEWVVGLLLTTALAWWSAMRAPGADLLTLPWYSRWDRVAINQLLFVAPLAAVGAVVLAARLAAGRTQAVVGLVAGALVAVPLVPQVLASRQMIGYSFSQASLVRDPERAAFAWLVAHVRPGQRVLNDVTDGSGWMWTLDGVTPLFTSQSVNHPAWGDRLYLQTHAARLATDAKAVAVADQWDVQWLYLGPDLFPFRKPVLNRSALLRSPAWRTVYDVDGVLVLQRVDGVHP